MSIPGSANECFNPLIYLHAHTIINESWVYDRRDAWAQLHIELAFAIGLCNYYQANRLVRLHFRKTVLTSCQPTHSPTIHARSHAHTPHPTSPLQSISSGEPEAFMAAVLDSGHVQKMTKRVRRARDELNTSPVQQQEKEDEQQEQEHHHHHQQQQQEQQQHEQQQQLGQRQQLGQHQEQHQGQQEQQQQQQQQQRQHGQHAQQQQEQQQHGQPQGQQVNRSDGLITPTPLPPEYAHGTTG